MLLASCADLFDPVNEIIGGTTGLWNRVSRHPAVLALAIKTLVRTSVFTPSPAELLAALKEAESKLGKLVHYTDQWLDTMRRADAIVFAFDRAAWDAAYAKVRSSVALAMLPSNEEPDEDEDGNAIAASPRWQALHELWERKLAAEEAAEIAAAPEPKRIAACEAKPSKRTHKPKGGNE
jgi:hypothetical protein